MSFLQLFIIAVGLSMDAFAVSVGKGLTLRGSGIRTMTACGLWFGSFQALMPAAGALAGSLFADRITRYDHWIAFVLLALIGGNMIREALEERRKENGNRAENERASEGTDAERENLRPGEMFLLAVATSIDALAVGVTFSFMNVRIAPACALIGVTTLVISAAGVKIGSLFGAKYGTRAHFAGGIVLILIGLEILLEHLGIL